MGEARGIILHSAKETAAVPPTGSRHSPQFGRTRTLDLQVGEFPIRFLTPTVQDTWQNVYLGSDCESPVFLEGDIPGLLGTVRVLWMGECEPKSRDEA